MNWFDEKYNFFGDSYLEEYFFLKNRTKQEVGFIKSFFPKRKNLSVLDIPCGFGRHSASLATKAVEVTGVDNNLFFLDIARSLGVQNTHFVHCDMRSFCHDDNFDIIINLFSSFGYFLSKKDDEKVIHNIARSLKYDGIFVLDILNKEFKRKNPFVNKWLKSHNNYFMLNSKFNVKKSVLVDDHVRVIDKKISQFKTYLRLYSFDEIVSLCQKYKLTLIYAFGDMNRKVPFNEENSPRMVLVFKKTNFK